MSAQEKLQSGVAIGSHCYYIAEMLWVTFQSSLASLNSSMMVINFVG